VYLEPVIALVLFLAIFWLGSNRMRSLSRQHPASRKQDAIFCGYYPTVLTLFYTWFRIDVNSDGFLLTQIVLPFIWRVSTFIPWNEVVIRESGSRVFVGAIDLPTVEIPLKSIVLSTMQSRLNRKVPVGHVV
jgi:hypothetical protein